MRRRVAGNLLWMLAERGIQVAAGIGIVAMLARALGPEGFAHFQYAQAVVLIAASVALICGGEVIVPRLVATTLPQAQHRLLAHAFSLRLGGAILGYLLMCGYLLLQHPAQETWTAALLLGIAILLREPFGIVVAWMQAHTNNRPNTLFSLASLAVKAGLVAALFVAGKHSVPLYAGAFAIEAVIMACLLAIHYYTHAQRGSVQYDYRVTRELMSSGALFWVSFMLMMGARRIDQLVLQPAVPLADFGAYAACMQILDNYTVVATILAAGVAPMYVYGKAELAIARANIARIVLGMTATGLCGAILIAVGAPWIVQLLYGHAFAPTASLLRAAAVSSTLIFADVGLTLLPVYLRRPDWIAIKWAGVLGVTLVFDLATVPTYGAWGAVGGYTVGNAIAVAFGVFLWWRSRKAPALATT
ncbi:lipopolysaccharide biosynthesis protein [Cupriavidus sp. 2TAF22]|uniref:lipopolysaccharide biosynthesis protein n=1 Tax=unclassified Cupriavidus TaxID=2640874 RepID=UPI003F8E57AF